MGTTLKPSPSTPNVASTPDDPRPSHVSRAEYAGDLAFYCERIGVRLRVEAGQLRMSARPGALDDDLRAELSSALSLYRPELIDRLESLQGPPRQGGDTSTTEVFSRPVQRRLYE